MDYNIFRAYDIRGTYPKTINADIALTIGKGYGSYIQEKYNKNTCVVGHDNRLSSEELSNALIQGIISTGCNVIDYGLTTTPMHYYARYLNNMLGIMVTASHNPKDDNGFKFSFDNLSNARGSMIEDFKNYIIAGQFKTGTGTVTNSNMFDKYLEYMKLGITLGPRKIKAIIDCGNGVTCTVARKIHEKFNIDFEIICEENDGTFPNHHPDPNIEENLSMLKKKVLQEKADLGIAYDGDGDRVGIIDNEGNFVTTEEFMILIIRDIINNVKNKTFLYDVKCSKCLEDEIIRLGGTPYCYCSGASFTQAKTKEDNLAFGGEYSGHIYFRDKVNDCCSGIYGGLRIIEILSKTDKKLSELLSNIPKYYHTPEKRIEVADNIKFQVVDKIKDFCSSQGYSLNTIDGVRVNFTNGWFLIRASNTGPNLTLRAEAQDKDSMNKLQKFAEDLVETYTKQLKQ